MTRDSKRIAWRSFQTGLGNENWRVVPDAARETLMREARRESTKPLTR